MFGLGLIAIVAPCVYLYEASQLPALETEFDLQKLIRFQVEGERMSIKLGQYASDLGPVAFERPDFSKLPKDLVAVYLSQQGCATYFQTPRESGAAWTGRLVAGLVGGSPGGDGRCDRLFAWRLARRVGADGTLALTVGANKVRGFLTQDQLIAYELSSLWFEPGVVGVEAASRRLFKRKLAELSLAEAAEFALALPPHSYYATLRDCQNPSLIRQDRDIMLRQLAGDALVSEGRAKSAMADPVACTRE